MRLISTLQVFLKAAGPLRIAANLPYNIATVLLIGLVRVCSLGRRFTIALVLMFQREVAERPGRAAPTAKAYGRLSVLAQWRTATENPVRHRAHRPLCRSPR